MALICGLAGAAAAATNPVAPPESWTRYAEGLVYQVGDLIETSDTPAAIRLREALAATGASRVVRIWADPAGVVVKIESGAESGPAFEDDLRALMMNRTLAEAPPKALRWPVSIRLSAAASGKAAPGPAIP